MFVPGILVAVALAALEGRVRAQESASTAPPSLTVSTASPSPSAASDAPLPSQEPVPPAQSWCPSEIFCAGPLLQTVNVANLYEDQKTFVDKPTSRSPQEVLATFSNLTNSSSVTIGQVAGFVENNFAGEGLELQALALENFNPEPAFLNNARVTLVRGFAQTVHGYWIQLIRGTNSSTLCDGTSCESSLIPLNHTFVVPGGRFREQYYWDSFWIVEGLLESELYDIANATLQNFMDELENIGFIPNGGRIYYLNRSQPPLFIQMLTRYVEVTTDTAILDRALPLAERELQWWQENRTVNVTSPTTGRSYRLARFDVNNSAPRPESYLVDYETAAGLNESERADLYAELASGAESGWDYTTRWLEAGTHNLTTLQVRSTIPIDLNSILYNNYVQLSNLYTISGTASLLPPHEDEITQLREGILDLFWNSSKLAFYDFNLNTQSQNQVFSAANFYPLWSGIIPPELLNSSSNTFGFFSSLNLVLRRYNGTFPSTFIDTGLQWDFPNAWPPHQYIALKALRTLPSNVTNTSLPTPSDGQSTFSLIPSGQLGFSESDLPGQPVAQGSNSTGDVSVLGSTVVNGGNATDNEGWAQALERELANRYFTSAFCSWYATGGSIEGILPRRSDEELNITESVNNTGNMFEKFSNLDVNSAGRGGEYTVQAGFGWTNGVLLWVTSVYGDVLQEPQCPDLRASAAADDGDGSSEVLDRGSDDGATQVKRTLTSALLLVGVILGLLL